MKVQYQKSLKELILDPLLRELLYSMLELDPHKRITCRNALQHKFFY